MENEETIQYINDLKALKIGPNDSVVIQVPDDQVKGYIDGINNIKRKFPNLQSIPFLVFPKDETNIGILRGTSDS